jgi:hypothetical protein
MTKNLSVVLEGKGPLTLRQSDYVATGGEGTVYRTGNIVHKIYTDPEKMRRDGMEEKILLLKPLQHPFIVAPIGVIENGQGTPIGFYMPYAEGEPLPRVFTSAFWARESFTTAKAMKLVEGMREVVQFAHSKGAIIVDGNEFNWLAKISGKKDPEPRAIDVDSWSIGKFGAKVIMPSIRDPHSREFTESTDWYSWGIVTFQIFTGIHPFKGRLDGFERNDFQARMRANASVFSPGIGLNNAVRDFGDIPGPLLDWYRSTFHQGERSVPPSPFEKGVRTTPVAARTVRVVQSGADMLEFAKIFEIPNDPVIQVFDNGVVRTVNGSLYTIKDRKRIGTLSSPDGEVARVSGGYLLADWAPTPDGHGRSAVYTFVDDRTFTETALTYGLRGHRFVRSENRLFLVTEDYLIELEFMNVGQPILAAKQQRISILQPKATQWFDRVGIQEAFGAYFMVLPFGEKACVTVRTPELDGLVPIIAKAGNRFVAVVAADKNGEYKRLSFAFTGQYDSYTATTTTVDGTDLNMVILPKGVVAMIEEDGELIITVPSTGLVRKVSDKMITTNLVLGNDGDTVVYIKDGALWSVRTK